MSCNVPFWKSSISLGVGGSKKVRVCNIEFLFISIDTIYFMLFINRLSHFMWCLRSTQSPAYSSGD